MEKPAEWAVRVRSKQSRFPARTLLLKFLRSPHFAAAIICVYIFLFVLGTLIPQEGAFPTPAIDLWVGEHGTAGTLSRGLGLTRLQTSGFLITTHVAFFTSVMVCMMHRFGSALRSLAGRLDPPASTEALSLYGVRSRLRLRDPESGLHWAVRHLREKGYTVRFHEDRLGFLAVRGRLAAAGSVVFHLSFLILAAAGVLSAVSYFSGTAFVGVGERFTENSPYVYATSRRVEDLPRVRFVLEELETRFTDGNHLRRFDARLKVDDGRRVRVGINRPYQKASLAVYLVNFGYAPLWLIQTADGEVLDGAYVKILRVEEEDNFQTGRFPYRVFLRLYPDGNSKEGGEHASLELRNPILDVRVENRGKTLFQGPVKVGEGIPMDGARLVFPEIRKWGQFRVVVDRGTPVAFSGFGVLLLGLGLRFIRLRKQIAARVAERPDSSLVLGGRCEIFPYAFALELQRLEQLIAERDEAGHPVASGARSAPFIRETVPIGMREQGS